MQQFEWRDVASDALVSWICDAAGCSARTVGEDLRPLLADLLSAAGGAPVTESPFSDAAALRIGIGLVDDALREAFAKDIISYAAAGTTLEHGKGGPLGSQIALADLVHVNWCTEKELDGLPDIGAALARRIVEERRRGGAFRGGHDLASRVPGIGQQTIVKLQHRLRFTRRPTAIPAPATAGGLLKVLVSRTGAPPVEGLRRVLEHATSHVAATARTRWYATQLYTEDPPATPHDASSVGVLRGSEYYRWLTAAIGAAATSIDMAMFHVAMPKDDHPTRTLIDALIAAHRRGVRVRVLLDRDRPEDPYGSSVINAPALAALKAAGVSARVDRDDQLLHSKLLVLDAQTVVVGSHNWSAGSYFGYDDVSLAVHSESFAKELSQRFETMWAAGT